MSLALVIFALAIALMALAFLLRRRSGLPQGRVIYSDTGAWQRNDHALFSAEHQLVGKPDYLVAQGDVIVPVEVKSGAAPAQPRPGHILQLAAYCVLVEEQLGRRVTHGIIQYADKQFAVAYTPALKADLLRALDGMRQAIEAGDAHRDHTDPRRCAACGVRDACDERLA